MITIVISRQDPPMQYFYDYFVSSLLELAVREYRVTFLTDPDTTGRDDIIAALRESEGIFFFTHGLPDGIVISDKLVTGPEDAPLYEDKIVYAVSCSAAINFGSAISEYGSFLGYAQDTMFFINGRLGALFIEPLLQPAYSLLLGRTVHDAYVDTIEVYDRLIEYLEGKPKYSLALGMMKHNKKSFVVIGDEDRKLTKEGSSIIVMVTTPLTLYSMIRPFIKV